MRLRFWACEALSGDVVAELPMVDAAFSSRFDGGRFSGTVPLAAMTRDDSVPDWAEVQRRLDLVQPGRRTVVVTDDAERVLGEWLMLSRSRATSGDALEVEGIGWERYPSFRSLHTSYTYSNTSQMGIAKALLTGAFLTWNDGMQIDIPSVASTVYRDLTRAARSCYYSDALAEIAEPADGFEWCVDVSAGSWSGGALAGVARAVTFGQPVVSRASAVVIEQGEPGTRHGNALSVTGGDDFARYAQSVYGIGPGQGDKQQIIGLSDPTLTNLGYLNSTRNVSYPDVEDAAALTALTEAALEAAQDMRDPYTAEVLADSLPEMPKLGSLVALRCPRSLGYPDGLDETVRVGEVAYRAQGVHVSTVTIQAI